MRLFPETIAELDLNMRWVVPLRLQLIDEVVCDPGSFGARVPRLEEAWRRARLAVAQRNRRAEDRAVTELIRAQVWDWWQNFSERPLFTELYERADRQGDKTTTKDSTEAPSPCERRRLARALLVDIPYPDSFDPEEEVTETAGSLAAKLLPPIGRPTRPAVRYYMSRSESIPTYFDALTLLGEMLDKEGMSSNQHRLWRQEVADGLRLRPDREPIPAQRPATTDRFKFHLHIQFILEVLRRVGVLPRGRYPSGCVVVSEVLEISDYTVERIWKERPWEKSFIPAMRKYSRAIAERTGLHRR